MKKTYFLVASIVVLFCKNSDAQTWDQGGNTVSPPFLPIIGTINTLDFNFITDNQPRGKITADGNWDIFNNNFNNTQNSFAIGQNTITNSMNIFATGNNNLDSSNFCLAMGMNNMIFKGNSSATMGTMNNLRNGNNCFILGSENNMVTPNHAVVLLGAHNMADSSDESVATGEDQHMKNGHGTFMGGGHSFTNGMYNITMGSRLFTTGSFLQAYGDSISNNLDSSIAMGFKKNRTLVITKRGINIQVSPGATSTPSPTHNLKVDANPSLGVASNISFLNLPKTTTNLPIVVIDTTTGELFRTNPSSSGSGISSACSTQFFVPRVSSTGSPNLTCSQIFDSNGTAVGINKTSGFSYSSLSGARLGTIVPPSSGIIRLDVNGVTRSLASIVTSDSKFKSNIHSIPSPLTIIKSLSGKTYTWTQQAQKSLGADNGLHIGYLAQDLQKIIPEVVITDNEGNLAVNYIEIIPILSEAIKEQQKQIEAQNTKIEKLEAQLQNGTKATNLSVNDGSKLEGAYLAQNVPNPFSNNTEIKYQLPKGTQTAMLGIYDLNGKQVKMYPINTENNSGSITVQAQELQAGMYLYTLVVDGKAFDTKRMVLTAQ